MRTIRQYLTRLSTPKPPPHPALPPQPPRTERDIDLRDRFAISAMAGAASAYGPPPTGPFLPNGQLRSQAHMDSCARVAEAAYICADAALAARAVQP